MKCSIRRSSEQQLQQFYTHQKTLSFSYREQGQSAGIFPAGYDHDRNGTLLGHGNECFQQACQTLSDWRMFPDQWTRIFPNRPHLKEGETVVVQFRLATLWWFSACRIVYVINQPDRFGFAYGTLTSHVEKGEEVFYVEKLPNGEVWYCIEAFSRPRFWLARLFYPLARHFQRRFVRDSKQQMWNHVQELQKAAYEIS